MFIRWFGIEATCANNQLAFEKFQLNPENGAFYFGQPVKCRKWYGTANVLVELHKERNQTENEFKREENKKSTKDDESGTRANIY